jgi:hypothetical protein
MCKFRSYILLGLSATAICLLVLLRESIEQHYIRVLDLHASSTTQPSNEFVWLPSTEGLSSRFFQIEAIHSHLIVYNRSLVIANMLSIHNHDVGRVNVCDIFVLPESIRCSNRPVSTIVLGGKCVSCIPAGKLHNHLVTGFLPAFVLPAKDFSWQTTTCAVLVGYEMPSNSSPKRKLPIPVEFQSKHVQIRDRALSYLLNVSLSTAAAWGGEIPANLTFVAVHWRRGDQLTSRCHGADHSFNCGTVDQLTDFVQQSGFSLPAHGTNIGNKSASSLLETEVVVFVATNEEDPDIYQKLHSRGMHTYRSIPMHLNSVETFAMEVQLMAAATSFLYAGVSGVHDLVMRLRPLCTTRNCSIASHSARQVCNLSSHYYARKDGYRCDQRQG